MSAECRKIAGSFPQPTYDGPLCSCQGGCALEIDPANLSGMEIFAPGDDDRGCQIPYEIPYDQSEEAEKVLDAEHAMRQFETGATRNKEVDPDIYGFTSPLALGMFAEYMHANRLQADGTMRDSDNWKKGIPLDSYIRSMRRHMQDLTLIHDGYEGLAREGLMEALGGLFFNVQGYMHEIVKEGLEAGVSLEEKIMDVVAALFPAEILVPEDTVLTTTFEGETEETDA